MINNDFKVNNDERSMFHLETKKPSIYKEIQRQIFVKHNQELLEILHEVTTKKSVLLQNFLQVSQLIPSYQILSCSGTKSAQLD